MYSVQEVAKLWKLSDRRVREMCAKGLIPKAQKLGKSYLIPKDTPKPTKTKRVPEKPKSEICIISNNDNNLIASSLCYNFFCDEINVDTNNKILKLSNRLRCNHLDTKTILKNLEESKYKLIIFVETLDKKILKNINNTKVVYIGNNEAKNLPAYQIIKYNLPDTTHMSTLALSFLSQEGILKQIYNIISSIRADSFPIPLTFNFNNTIYPSNLIYNLPSIQKSYDFLASQYEFIDPSQTIYNVSIGNLVEFSDSNQELDYAVKVINALKRNVSINFIYIFDKPKLGQICHHFTTKAYLQALNQNSALYFVNKANLSLKTLEFINEGIILYGNQGVYHDKISEYSLGYVNANNSHIEQYQLIINELLKNCTKITNIEEMEKFYELHK